MSHIHMSYLHDLFQAISVFVFHYLIHFHGFCFHHAFFRLQIKHSTFSQFVLFSLVCHQFPLLFQCQPNWRYLILLSIAICYGSQLWRGRTTNRTGRLSDRVSFCSCCSLRALMVRFGKDQVSQQQRSFCLEKKVRGYKELTPPLIDWESLSLVF